MLELSREVLIPTACITCLLTLIIYHDVKSYKIPNHYVYTLIILGLLWPSHPHGISHIDRLIAAVAAYSALWSIGEIFFRLRGIEGLGIGDAKLAAAMGAWLGWRDLPSAIFVSSVLAIAYLAVNNLKGTSKVSLPFAPALAAGFATFWIIGMLR